MCRINITAHGVQPKDEVSTRDLTVMQVLGVQVEEMLHYI